ncbi:hypothetical protein CH373_12240 [Leptospira perolatii]|uniref:GFO/IDH/MocA-like oxidoreductase domain-containing protein n=1 Tax=Leptospira perolatii TaxID=2023191 RepID=A0A2M9ZLD6_9LEPT|nr:Gfo/Idh/MocA family oxidoreductase [Leptospira perolatii]PJZ70291.1 hypothetical protein CH360_06730 [Leptospira perolatii]PJZ72825.1 hypothetical protein CH373_12240 [Leptospira perolatii]
MFNILGQEKNIKALVIGAGSIGLRHARLLSEMNAEVRFVSNRSDLAQEKYQDLETALQEWDPGLVVISNETSKHLTTLVQLFSLGYRKLTLVEKPLFSSIPNLQSLDTGKVFVGYNLRFHPLIQKLKEILTSDVNIFNVTIYAGQYLPEWRPGTDYTKSYSAQKKEGGGVLRDLSHELDFIQFLFGKWQKLVSLGGQISALNIETEDLFTIIIASQRSPIISTTLSYLDKIYRREILVNTDQGTIYVDLINGVININNNVSRMNIDRDFTYKKQYESLFELNHSNLCTFEEGLDVVAMIESIEESSRDQRWVIRN